MQRLNLLRRTLAKNNCSNLQKRCDFSLNLDSFSLICTPRFSRFCISLSESVVDAYTIGDFRVSWSLTSVFGKCYSYFALKRLTVVSVLKILNTKCCISSFQDLQIMRTTSELRTKHPISQAIFFLQYVCRVDKTAAKLKDQLPLFRANCGIWK